MNEKAHRNREFNPQVYAFLMADLETLRASQNASENNWRMVMAMLIPTMCGVFELSNKSSIMVLFMLSTIVFMMMYIALFQRMLNERKILRCREKIIHHFGEQDIDVLVSSSYDHRFFEWVSLPARFIMRLDLFWLACSNIACLLIMHFERGL